MVKQINNKYGLPISSFSGHTLEFHCGTRLPSGSALPQSSGSAQGGILKLQPTSRRLLSQLHAQNAQRFKTDAKYINVSCTYIYYYYYY